MTIRLLLRAALTGAVIAFAWASGQTPLPTASPPASVAASPSLRTPLRLAPFKERLAAAKSVKVETDILGVKLDSSLGAAHAVLDSLCDSAHRPKEEAGEAERGKKHYYRVQGPTFLIEYDNTQNDANHIHSVWRDFNGDFGRDLLREHLATTAH